MPCCYCERRGGALILIGHRDSDGAEIWAHQACFDAADRADEAAMAMPWMPAPEMGARILDYARPIGPEPLVSSRPCACGCGEQVPYRHGRGQQSAYLSTAHWLRAYRARNGRRDGPRHISRVLAEALAKIPKEAT